MYLLFFSSLPASPQSRPQHFCRHTQMLYRQVWIFNGTCEKQDFCSTPSVPQQGYSHFVPQTLYFFFFPICLCSTPLAQASLLVPR